MCACRHVQRRRACAPCGTAAPRACMRVCPHTHAQAGMRAHARARSGCPGQVICLSPALVCFRQCPSPRWLAFPPPAPDAGSKTPLVPPNEPPRGSSAGPSVTPAALRRPCNMGSRPAGNRRTVWAPRWRWQRVVASVDVGQTLRVRGDDDPALHLCQQQQQTCTAYIASTRKGAARCALGERVVGVSCPCCGLHMWACPGASLAPLGVGSLLERTPRSWVSPLAVGSKPKGPPRGKGKGARPASVRPWLRGGGGGLEFTLRRCAYQPVPLEHLTQAPTRPRARPRTLLCAQTALTHRAPPPSPASKRPPTICLRSLHYHRQQHAGPKMSALMGQSLPSCSTSTSNASSSSRMRSHRCPATSRRGVVVLATAAPPLPEVAVSADSGLKHLTDAARCGPAAA